MLGYLLLCWLGVVAAMLLVRENSCDSVSFFHLRQAYILLIIMHLLNGLAFAALLSAGWSEASLVFLGAWTINLVLQAYKISRFALSDTIHEPGLHAHPKRPLEFTVALRIICSPCPGRLWPWAATWPGARCMPFSLERGFSGRGSGGQGSGRRDLGPAH